MSEPQIVRYNMEMPINILSWEKKYTQGVKALASGAYDEATACLKQAVDIAGRLGEEEPLLHSFLSLGDVFKFAKDYASAKKSYSQVISRAENNSDFREVSIIARGCLGMLYMAQHDVDKALVELEKAVDLIKRQRHLRSAEFAPIIMGLAGVYMEMEQFESADKVCTYAYEYSTEVLGPSDTCTIAAMNLCALCADILGRPKRATALRGQMSKRIKHLDETATDELGIISAFPGGLAPLAGRSDARDSAHAVETGNVPHCEDLRSSPHGGDSFVSQHSENPPVKKTTAQIKSGVAKSNVLQFPNVMKSDATVVSKRSSVQKADATAVSKRNSLQKADELVRCAWSLPETQHAKLAKEAIKLSPDCVNAYLLLVETISKPDKRIPVLRKAIDAANRTLAPGWQEKYEGACWQFTETRPVLRAMAILADCLKWQDELDEALELYRKLLKLTRSDNQGIRYLLAPCLFEAGLDAELDKLLKDYSNDPSAALLYTKALHLFKNEGASKGANSALLKAFDANPFVPLFLSEAVEIPENNTDRIGVGDESEAAAYIEDCSYLWDHTDGAATWLAVQLERAMRKRFPDQNMIDSVLIELKLE